MDFAFRRQPGRKGRRDGERLWKWVVPFCTQPSALCAAAWFMCGTQLKPSQRLKSSPTRNQAGGKGKKKVF